MKLWIDLPKKASMKTLITQISNILKVNTHYFQEYDHALIKIVAIFFICLIRKNKYIKINKWDLIKHKSFCRSKKKTLIKWKDNLINRGKYLQMIWQIRIEYSKYINTFYNPILKIKRPEWTFFKKVIQMTSRYMKRCLISLFSSVQFSRSVMSDSLRPHELQFARPPCSSPTPEFTQTHVHRVGDAMQPSHPLSSTFPPAPNPSQHQSLF